jgi:hypothetical protein
MLCWGRRQDTVDDAGAVEAGDDRDAPGHGGRLEAVDLLHPSDIALDVRPSRSGWVETALGATAQEGPNVRFGVLEGPLLRGR